MKPITIYVAIALFALTLSSCKKDCNGSFTIEGTLWNGSKNQPYTNTKIEITAGGKSSLYTGALNVRDLGTVYTNNLGKFTFTYNCINQDDWNIALNPQISSTSPFLEIPINQNYSQFYNIPDSVSLDIYFEKKSGFSNTDTFYYEIGVSIDSETGFFLSNNIPSGFYKRFRIPYQIAVSRNFSISVKTALGIVKFKQVQATSPPASTIKNIAKLEPEINSYTINY